MKNNIISGGTALTTFGAGMASVADVIPAGIGKIACLIGIFGTIVVILVNIGRLRKLDLEIKYLKKHEDDE